MTRLLATLTLALAVTLTTTPADATRVKAPGPNDADRCWNVPGTQPSWVVGRGAHPAARRFRFKVRTPEPGDCRAVRWLR